MLDYRIETFLTLCRERNYSKTAQALCITQPAVTQHIQYLERLYDTKLFEYENKQLTLTKQGHILERMAMGLSASNKRVFELINESKTARKHLKIGASRTLGECIMPMVLSKLLEHTPDLRITIAVDSTEKLLQGLRSGLYECLFVEGSFSKETFEHRLFSKEEFIAISGTKRPNMKEEEFLKEVIICREPGSGPRKILDDILTSRNATLDIFKNVIEVNNLTLMKELVKNNVGIGLTYRAAVIDELEKGNLFEIQSELALTKEFSFLVLKNNLFLEQYLDLYTFAKQLYEETLTKENFSGSKATTSK